eukprot:2817278-Prymnesium_polylepis.1
MRRVSEEIQPMLDGWQQAVDKQLRQMHDAEEDWIAGFRQGLAELRDEVAQRARREETLKACYEKLADEGGVGPKLVKRVDEQTEAIGAALSKLQSTVAESRKVVERTERATNSDKRALLKATAEETAAAIRTAASGVEAAERRAATLEVELEERASRAARSEEALNAARDQTEQLRLALVDSRATEQMLEEV